MKSNSKYEYKILIDLQQYYNNIGVNCEEKKECCWMCEQTPPPSVARVYEDIFIVPVDVCTALVVTGMVDA